ncbi:MAG: heavy metal translocating P-type ATPase [Dehalococcoidia bacterium]|nr:heavy metal translocating P-type ATPase [Dehalococcoidia bacterium]
MNRIGGLLLVSGRPGGPAVVYPSLARRSYSRGSGRERPVFGVVNYQWRSGDARTDVPPLDVRRPSAPRSSQAPHCESVVDFARRYLLLAFTVVGIAAGGVAWVADAHRAADIAWAATAAITSVPVGLSLLRQLLRRQGGVDVIALLAMVGAVAFGEYLAAAVIALMVASGAALEEYASARATRELSALLQRAPRSTWRLEGDALVEIAIEAVRPGDVLVVRDSDVVPVDGIVVQGPAVLDESALTGESRLVERGLGERVASGVVNAGSPFRLRAAATAEASTYAGIIRLVRAAQETKAPLVRLADRYAAFFVPVTLAVAGFAWAISGSPERALAVIVVATPCPLLLAAPVAIVSGVSRAARRGIVVKGGGAIEVLARARSVYLDKTGTLTAGSPAVTRVAVFGQVTEPEVLRLAASLDQLSSHVMAAALVRAARERGLALALPSGVAEDAGAGIRGTVEGRAVRVGRFDWLKPGDVPDHVRRFRRGVLREGGSTVFVEVDGELAGAFVLQDPIRPEAPRAIRALKRAGVAQVVMVTGDHPAVADAVGAALGVDRVIAGCSPGEKVEAVRLAKHEAVTIMVGDGINDAPALAAADVGVAMGARGATSSSEAADMVLMVDRLDRLVEGLAIAKRTRRIAVESMLVGMALSFVAMGFAALGHLPPVFGALLQEGIDVVAILNALRALGGGAAGRPPGRLPAGLAAELRAEHLRLEPALDQLRVLADRIEELPPGEAAVGMAAMRAFLRDDVIPHEQLDEREVYPQLGAILGGHDPLGAMSRTHQEIFHLCRQFEALHDDMPAAGPDREDLTDIRRVLYALHTVLRLNVAQEEELFLSLDDHYLERAAAPAA